MSTYLINHLRIPGGIPNEQGLSYLEQVEATVRPFGGKWLAQGEGTVLEGAWPGSVVLMEFPTRADAEHWYASPAYRAILPLRLNTTIGDLILVDAVDPDATVAGVARSIRAAMATTSGVEPSSGSTSGGVTSVATKITFIYDNPRDPAAFEAGYPAHLALAKKLPGLQRVETAKVWPKEDGTPTPAHRLVDLYFADYDAASRAVASEAAAAFFPSVFALATGGVRIVFADVEES